MNIDALKMIDKNVKWIELDGGELVVKILTNILIANYLDVADWNKLAGLDWACLLRKQPQFSEFCDWEKLDGWDWSWLLSKQPQFSGVCDWDKLRGLDWSWLLSKQPQFRGGGDLDKIDEFGLE